MIAISALDKILQGLMQRYENRVPNVRQIIDCMVRSNLIECSSDIENDHIAFRTLGVPQLGIRSLEKVFLHHGYQRRDAYRFEKKKLDAYWYSPPEKHFPRIFISELRVDALSLDAQKIINSYTSEVVTDPVDQLDLDDADQVIQFLHQPLWRTPTWADYEFLSNESEYAAWVIYNRYYLNHFTISVHNLPGDFGRLAEFNDFLEKHGFQLNDSGGKIKSSTDGLLLQSSTVAEMIEAEFSDGASGVELHDIAGSYVEFAERLVLPEFNSLRRSELKREHRREGFEAANADKIFESTYAEQTSRVSG
ncbi:MAG: DUF1338 domain-containing protein [Planctomycetota bacterium]